MQVLKSLLGRFARGQGSRRANPHRRQLGLDILERRQLLSASLVISEVHPSGSGNGTYAVDWFELTNTGAAAVDVTGWKMDDNSNAFASAAALRGVGVIPAGKSAVFFDNSAALATTPVPTYWT